MIDLFSKACSVLLFFFYVLHAASPSAIFPCDTQPVSVNVVNNTVLTYNGSLSVNQSCVWQLTVPDDSYMIVSYNYAPRNATMNNNDLQFVGQTGQVFISAPSYSYNSATPVPSYRGFTAVNATLAFTNSSQSAQFNITLILNSVNLYNMSSSKSYRIAFTKKLHAERSGHVFTFDSTNTHYILIKPLWWNPTSIYSTIYSDFVNIRAPGTNVTRLSTLRRPILGDGSLIIAGNRVTVTLDMAFSSYDDSASDNLYIVGLHGLPEANTTTFALPGYPAYHASPTVVMVTFAEGNWCKASLSVWNNSLVDVYVGDSRSTPMDNSSYVMRLDSKTHYSAFLFIGDAYTFDVRSGYFGISCEYYPSSPPVSTYVSAKYTGAIISQGYPLSVPGSTNRTSTSFVVSPYYGNISIHYNYHVTLAGNTSSFSLSTPKNNPQTFNGPGVFTKSGSPKTLTIDFTSTSLNDRFVLVYSAAMSTTTSWLLVSVLMCARSYN